MRKSGQDTESSEPDFNRGLSAELPAGSRDRAPAGGFASLDGEKPFDQFRTKEGHKLRI